MSGAMTEREHAKLLADKVLDRPGGDPDDDLAVLARQFLRSEERAADTIKYVSQADAMRKLGSIRKPIIQKLGGLP